MDLVEVNRPAPSYAWLGAEDEQQYELAASIHRHFIVLAETLRSAAEQSADPAERERLRAALSAARRGQELAHRLVYQLDE